MADKDPSPAVLKNLDLLLTWDVLAAEQDWIIVRDLEKTPPAKMIDKDGNASTSKKEDDDD